MNSDLIFTEESQIVAQQASTIAFRNGQNHITREHILLAFFEVINPKIENILNPLRPAIEKTRNRLEFLVSRRAQVVPTKNRQEITLSIEMKQVIDSSKAEMMRIGQEKISSRNLFVALIGSYFYGINADRTLQEILNQIGLTPEFVRESIIVLEEKEL